MITVTEKIPDIAISVVDSSGRQTMTTNEIFSAKKAVVFTVPGAFTPTCSARHLPGFIEHAEAFKAKGIDLIACLSVNDAFVMEAWAINVGSCDDVLMIADGNAELVRALDLDDDQSLLGMGMRARRSAMIIRDSIVESVFVEPKGSFGISSAESVLKAL